LRARAQRPPLAESAGWNPATSIRLGPPQTVHSASGKLPFKDASLRR